MGRETPNSIWYHKGGKKYGQVVWGQEVTREETGWDTALDQARPERRAAE